MTIFEKSMCGVLAPGRREAYILAGNATVTVKSLSTGTRFTYKVTKAGPTVYFVGVLSGPDNEVDYSYIGIVRRGVFTLTRKSRAGMSAASVRAFAWLSRNWEDDRAEVWHEGRCGRCGRTLTVPESIKSGIGPVCEEK